MKEVELVEITSNQDEEEGWQDLIFSITERNLAFGCWNLKCEGLYKGEKVGVRIHVLEGIEAGIVNNDIDSTKFVSDAIQIESIGEESDKLIQIVSKLYEKGISEEFTPSKLSYTIFPLNHEDADLEKGKYKFKLFFDIDNEQELYHEFYLNPNLPNGTLELNEKDVEYRENIIKSMTETDGN